MPEQRNTQHKSWLIRFTNKRQDLMRADISSETIQILVLLAALAMTVLLSCLRGWCWRPRRSTHLESSCKPWAAVMP